MENPFTLSFGEKPQSYIDRVVQKNIITQTFAMKHPTTHAFMIVGIRGSGKTLMLSDLSQEFKSDKSWSVINLSADADLLSESVTELQSLPALQPTHIDMGLNLAVVNVSRQIQEPGCDYSVLLRQQIRKLNDAGKKIIFFIDEVVNNDYVRAFCSNFQVMLRERMPVFLVMAGLYENISDLQNVKTLTFLYRTPKIYLDPLNIPTIAEYYRSMLGISSAEAIAMAKETKGYPFAFQILGYLRFRQQKPYTELFEAYDQLLAEYVYDRIWAELSEMDKKVVMVIASGTTKIKDIRDTMQITPQLLNVYRNRLMRVGIADGSHRGELTLTLPRFDRFIDLYGVI